MIDRQAGLILGALSQQSRIDDTAAQIAGDALHHGIAQAGSDPSLCHSETTRLNVPSSFPLGVCFDGNTLVLANTFELPIEIRTDHGGIPNVTPNSDATLPGSITSILRPAADGLTPPHYTARLSNPADATRLDIAVSATAKTYC